MGLGLISQHLQVPSPSAMTVMNTQTFHNTIGIIGNVISFFLFASPTPTYMKILKSKSVGEFKADPYLATLMNCMLWTFYATPMVKPGCTFVIIIDGVGLALAAIYIAIFILYAHNKKAKVKIVGCVLIEIVFVGILATITLKLYDSHEKRSTIVGIIAVIFCAVMYASPLTIMKKVIETRSVKYMPFCLSFASFLNAVVWGIYAVIDKFDIYILISSGLGVLCGMLQLIIYACYYKATPKEDQLENSAIV